MVVALEWSILHKDFFVDLLMMVCDEKTLYRIMFSCRFFYHLIRSAPRLWNWRCQQFKQRLLMFDENKVRHENDQNIFSSQEQSLDVKQSLDGKQLLDGKQSLYLDQLLDVIQCGTDRYIFLFNGHERVVDCTKDQIPYHSFVTLSLFQKNEFIAVRSKNSLWRMSSSNNSKTNSRRHYLPYRSNTGLDKIQKITNINDYRRLISFGYCIHKVNRQYCAHRQHHNNSNNTLSCIRKQWQKPTISRHICDRCVNPFVFCNTGNLVDSC